MKINQIISNIDENSGGTAIYLKLLVNSLCEKNINLSVTTLKSKNPLSLSNEIEVNFYEKIPQIF